jgi:glycerol-1-phosphate dehydrogenase [NAD(P)+]
MSGETKEADIEKSEVTPDIVIEDIGELAKLL